MFLAAAGMWKAQYWAVLGFEFFLGLTLVFAAVSLMFAGNALGVVYSLAILAGAGVLFWKLVRAMARLQMPKRPGAMSWAHTHAERVRFGDLDAMKHPTLCPANPRGL